MKVRDAVRISMSIPLYFVPIYLDEQGVIYKKQNEAKTLDVLVDGGVIGNFPIFIFDSLQIDTNNNKIRIPNPETVGVRIDSDKQIKNDKQSKNLVELEINNIQDYFTAFYIFIMENLNRPTLTQQDWDRTISVSSAGITPRIKKLSNKQKYNLVLSGKKKCKSFS